MRFLVTLASVMLISATASAHTGHGDTAGFVHGFAHPIGGLDHVLAMVAVGLFAAIVGGRALWRVPASFVAVMALGGVLGAAGLAVPFVEIAIAVSVVVLGGAVFLRQKLPVSAAMALVGFFAAFHGFAHGAEMPAAASGLAYGLGFVAATALLHAAGLAAGLGAMRLGAKAGPAVLRIGGGLVSLAGLGLLAGV